MDVKYSRDPGVIFPLVILGPLRSTDGAVAGATDGVMALAIGGAAAGATGGAEATGGAVAPTAPVPLPTAPPVGLADNSSRGGAEASEPTEPPPSYDSIYPVIS